MSTRPYILVALLTLALAGFGCSSEDETDRASAPSGNQNPGRAASAGSDGGAPETRSVEGLGDGIPEDMPLYPEDRVFASHRVKTNGTDVAVTYQSDDSVDDAAEYYRDVISDYGWELEDETVVDERGGVISAWKGNRQLIILTGTNGVETVIGVKIQEATKR